MEVIVCVIDYFLIYNHIGTFMSLCLFLFSQVYTPKHVVKSLPLLLVTKNSKLLAPGYQCRLCLKAFHLGQQTRLLPCTHKVEVTSFLFDFPIGLFFTNEVTNKVFHFLVVLHAETFQLNSIYRRAATETIEKAALPPKNGFILIRTHFYVYCLGKIKHHFKSDYFYLL